MEKYSYQKTIGKMVTGKPDKITPYLNGLNSPNERQRVARQIKKTKPKSILPSEDKFQLQGQILSQSEEVKSDTSS